MKRLASLLLVAIFALYLGGVQFMYWVKIDNAKAHAMSVINEHNYKSTQTRELTFTPGQYSSLQWLEPNKEFVFNGQHFDITEITQISGGIKITCYTDTEETDLADALKGVSDRLYNNTHQQGNSDNSNIISKVTKEYLPLQITFNVSTFQKSYSFIKEDRKIPLLALPASIWHPPGTC